MVLSLHDYIDWLIGMIEADYVVCTLPIGVLRSGNITFSPSLPKTKTQVSQSYVSRATMIICVRQTTHVLVNSLLLLLLWLNRRSNDLVMVHLIK